MTYKQLTTRRIFVICICKIGLLFLLVGRMFYMQFLKKDEYKTLSDLNRIKTLILNPSRGKIFDIDKKIVAENNVCFRLVLDKKINNNFLLEIELITKILELDKEQVSLINKRVKNGGRRFPITIIEHLNWWQLSALEERKGELKSVFIDTGLDRYYPSNYATAHLIGYLGRLQEKDKARYSIANKSFKLGKSGIESYYENKLRGNFGYKRIEVNAHGKYVRELDQTPSTPGENLYLNIDLELQNKTLPYLDQKGCSAVVMNCQNGAILISHSTPSYDPNKFNNLSTKYWHNLTNNQYAPLIDKTIQNLYPPGSIFKIITVIAALESGISPDHKIICTGGPTLGGNCFRCSSLNGHGSLNMIEAIKHSCNSYIYGIAMKTGVDKIIEVAQKFGFGTNTKIDIPGEVAGFLPTPKWKKKQYGNRWTMGDTLNLSIGQGFILATPMQLVRLISAIASNGKLFVPQIAMNIPEYTQINISQEHLDIVKTALYDTINSSGGTGYFNRINYKSMRMAGKTGTAQVRAKKGAHDNLNRKDIDWNYRNHAIFSGYAPFNNPKFAVSVYYDHGGGGGSAALPIAKKIMLDVLSKYS